MAWFCEGVRDGDSPPCEAILQVFRKQQTATGICSCRQDHCIPYMKLMLDGEIERSQQDRRRRFDDRVGVAPCVNRSLRLLGRPPDLTRQYPIELREYLDGNQRG